MSIFSGIGSALGLNKSTLGTLRDVGVGLLTGGPAGAVLAGAGSIASKLQKTPASPALPVLRPSVNYASAVPFAADPGQQTNIGLINIGNRMPALPGGAPLGPGNQTQSGWPGVISGSSSTAPPGKCIAGWHWNKTGYYRKGGPRSKFPAGWVEPYTVCVKNRRRNPMNPRALSRALGRVTSAKRVADTLDRVTVKRSCRRR